MGGETAATSLSHHRLVLVVVSEGLSIIPAQALSAVPVFRFGDRQPTQRAPPERGRPARARAALPAGRRS